MDSSTTIAANMNTRCSITIHGAVQGVGFRPFVYRLATGLGLTGWVLNSSQGVFIEIEGKKETIDSFLLRIEQEKPPLSCIQSMQFSFLDPAGFDQFEIKESNHEGPISALVMPDIATCPECVQEIFDPNNRRYLYPFTNCTNCGPRFSIIEGLPYDRRNTTMKHFEMCDECRFEYDNPLNRRFHAQPNACSECGPVLELWNETGTILALRNDAILAAANALRSGLIVALKGLGGFHLVTDAGNEDAVARLRRRKHREEKPFALMFHSLSAIKECCVVSNLEERLLCSHEAPIALLNRILRAGEEHKNIAPSVAPGNPYLGVMLPYTPLHHILLRELGFPIVATSGNVSDEPICIDEHEALRKLQGIADLFLVHNRPIQRHVDDSVARVLLGRESLIRRSRGYAPLPVQIQTDDDSCRLAVGAHLKNTVAFASSNNIFISQHIGDLETKESYEAFQHAITDIGNMYALHPESIVCDMHPQYLSTAFAHGSGVPTIEVQHHYAHVASCMAEHQLNGSVLGVSWDGTGYGPDNTIWGGEFLLTNEHSYERVASFRQFRLPGGDKAIKEPRRSALGLLFELFGSDAFTLSHLAPLTSFSNEELRLIQTMLEKNINAPATSSAGRLFDAISSLINVRHRSSFEGQAAMELEFLTSRMQTDDAYPYRILNNSLKTTTKPAFNRDICSNIQSSLLPKQPALLIDWAPIAGAILKDVEREVNASSISTKFHNALVKIIVEVAELIGEQRVVLTGGCFQNKYLTEQTVRALQSRKFQPYWHQRVPSNDGGIALGQLYAAKRSQGTKNFQQVYSKESAQ